MCLYKTIRALLFVCFPMQMPLLAQEYIFPQYNPVFAAYTLSSDSLEAGDTLIVTRTLYNDGQVGLEGLYLSDNLPPQFRLEDYSLTIDSEPAPVLLSGPSQNEIVDGYNCYRWIIDLPDSSSQYNRILDPGRRLELIYKLRCSHPGRYQLPFHNICGYAGVNGIFSVASGASVEFYAGICTYTPGDVNDDGHSGGMDIVYLVNYLKGGPEPPLFCDCGVYGLLMAASDANGDCAVNGLDVFYILNFCKGGPPPLSCIDCPPQ